MLKHVVAPVVGAAILVAVIVEASAAAQVVGVVWLGVGLVVLAVQGPRGRGEHGRPCGAGHGPYGPGHGPTGTEVRTGALADRDRGPDRGPGRPGPGPAPAPAPPPYAVLTLSYRAVTLGPWL